MAASHKGQQIELEELISSNSHTENLPLSWVTVTSEPIFLVSEKKQKKYDKGLSDWSCERNSRCKKIMAGFVFEPEVR